MRDILRFGRRRMRPGSLLGDWRLAISEAQRLRRKRMDSAAAAVLEERRGKILDELGRRRGWPRVLKHAHTIAAVLRREQERQAQKDLFRAENDG